MTRTNECIAVHPAQFNSKCVDCQQVNNENLKPAHLIVKTNSNIRAAESADENIRELPI